MNRQEARNILYEIHADAFEKDNGWLKEHADSLLKYLDQPLTLADFLGWEEDVKYEWSGDWYKVKGNTISWFDAKSRVTWIDVTNIYCGVDVDLERLLEFKKNAKKVKPKLKAWHTPDEYSFNESKKELNHCYEFIDDCDNYICEDEYKGRIYLKWTDNLKEIEDTHEIIEYKKEPPRFYAKIKGWELTNDTDCYWHKDENPIHGIYPWSEEEASIYTKEEWNKLGITDENADFERI